MTQTQHLAPFEARLAVTQAEKEAAQRLRYQVFVEELGGNGALVDHSARLERDAFDGVSEQLILIDRTRDEADQVIGVYRLMDQAGAQAAGQFYSESEFDLGKLLGSGRRVLELGRTCLHRDYRGGAAMVHLWQALAAEVQRRGAEVLFGVASFHGTDLADLTAPVQLLMRDHQVAADIRPVTRDKTPLPETGDVSRVEAMRKVPALIKAYLRLGGGVGDGVFVDYDFNTTDVCLVLDTHAMSPRQRKIYGGSK